MRVTKIIRPFALSDTNALGSGGGIIDSSGGDGQFPGSGQVPVATGSNGWAWGSNVQRIFSNTSNALLGPFVNFNSGSGITFAVASNTLTIAATGGGSTAYLPWFDVHDYGATGDGTTDDTTAIQLAMTAAETAGGGNVLFRRGKVYKVGGALQDTGRSNAQLLLPRINTSGGEQVTIRLIGEVGPPAIPYIDGASVDPDNGPVIKSTLGSGTGALLGTWGPSGSYLDFSLVRVVIEDLTFRMPADPTNSCLDLSHTETVEFRGTVMVDAGEYTMSSISSQSTSTSYGIKLPGNNNGASTALPGVVNVVGFYNGILVGEHTAAQNVQVWASRVGYTFPTAFHASHFERLAMYHCKVGMKFTGDHYFSASQVNVEHADSGTWTPTYDIDDASSFGHGHLTWHTVLQNTGVDHTFTVNGATDIYRVEIGDDPFGGGTTSPLTTKGDLWGYSTTDARFAVGSNGTVPVADSGQTVGLRYSVNAPSGELLISDTPAGSPLVFGDILQNELQDDLLYGDI